MILSRRFAPRLANRPGRKASGFWVSSRGIASNRALGCGRSFLGCYRLNGSSLRSAPYDLLHRIALSPSTTHRRWRRGNVGYTTTVEQDTEKERERTRAAKETARDQDGRTFIRRSRGKRREAFVRPRSVASGRIKLAAEYVHA